MSNIKKVLEGEIGEVYTATYAWIAYFPDFTTKEIPEDKIFCAWCKKSQADIKKSEDLNEHIDNHIK